MIIYLIIPVLKNQIKLLPKKIQPIKTTFIINCILFLKISLYYLLVLTKAVHIGYSNIKE